MNGLKMQTDNTIIIQLMGEETEIRQTEMKNKLNILGSKKKTSIQTSAMSKV